VQQNVNGPKASQVHNSFLFLGYGPISERVINQLTNLGEPKIYLITDRLLNFNLPDNVHVSTSIAAENIIKSNTFDFVINSWRSLKSPPPINRKKLLASLTRNKQWRTRIINLSSVAVYGNHDNIHSETSKVDPVNSYGLEKLDIELFIQNAGFFQVHNLRISNVFGDPNLGDLVNKIIFAAKNESELFLSEPNNVFRDFISINHVVDIIIEVINSDYRIPFETINVARGNSISLLELFEICEYYLDKKLYFSYRRLRPDEIKVSRLNNDKLLAQYPIEMESIKFQLQAYIEGLQH
jgi:dTDP-4-dehydrorhamnose reductase